MEYTAQTQSGDPSFAETSGTDIPFNQGVLLDSDGEEVDDDD